MGGGWRGEWGLALGCLRTGECWFLGPRGAGFSLSIGGAVKVFIVVLPCVVGILGLMGALWNGVLGWLVGVGDCFGGSGDGGL